MFLLCLTSILVVRKTSSQECTTPYIYGYSENEGEHEASIIPPRENTTPEECYALCRETEECANWHWLESTQTCYLKSRLMVEKALEIITGNPSPNMDPEYCNPMLPFMCGLFGCLECQSHTRCVWMTGDSTGGFRNCPADPCNPFADEITTSTYTEITKGATSTLSSSTEVASSAPLSTDSILIASSAPLSTETTETATSTDSILIASSAPSSTETTEAATSADSILIASSAPLSTDSILIASSAPLSTETTEGETSAGLSMTSSTIPSRTATAEGETSADSSTISSKLPPSTETTEAATSADSLQTFNDSTSTESSEDATSAVSHSVTVTDGETTQESSTTTFTFQTVSTRTFTTDPFQTSSVKATPFQTVSTGSSTRTIRSSTTTFPFQSASRLTPSELTTRTQSPSTLLSSADAGTEALTSSEFITILPSSDMLSTVTSQPQGRCGRNQQWYLKDAPEITVTFAEAEGVVFFVLHCGDVAYVSISLSSEMCMANFDPFVVDMSWGIVLPAIQEWAAIIKASETWTADSSGMTLYRPCLPDVELLPFWPDLADTMCVYSHSWASLNQVWPGAFPFVIEMSATRTHLSVVSRFSEYMIVTSYIIETGRPCTNLVFVESNITPLNSNISIDASELHARARTYGEAEFMTSWIQVLERVQHFLVQNRLLYIKTDQIEPAWFVGL